MGRKHSLKHTRLFHSILLSQVSAISMDDKDYSGKEVRTTDSYIREAPSDHANGESSLANGSSAKSNGYEPVTLRRTRSQSANEQETDGSQNAKQREIDGSQSAKEEKIDGSQTDRCLK